MSVTISVTGSRFERAFTVAFCVYRVTEDKDAGGAVVKKETEILHSRGFLEPLSGDEAVINARRDVVSSQRLFCLRECKIDETDRVEIKGTMFEVVFVADFDYGSSAHLEVYLGNEVE